jgi:hypothetical protein
MCKVFTTYLENNILIVRFYVRLTIYCNEVVKLNLQLKIDSPIGV